MNDLDAFARLVDALRPWLGQMVLVGGWAHRVHRLSSLAHPPAYQPVLTLDADLAFPATEAFEGNVASALRSAGFTERFLGEHTPPASHYTLGSEGSGFYAEFLTPLKGERHQAGRPRGRHPRESGRDRAEAAVRRHPAGRADARAG